jgi:thiol-disulfide isomerase/thioredoxin
MRANPRQPINTNVNTYLPGLTGEPAITIFTSSENNLDFYYGDSIGSVQMVLIRKGDTRLSIHCPVLLFKADENQVPYLIYPGEHILVKNDKNGYTSFSIPGNIQRNNELSFLKQLIQQTGPIYDPPGGSFTLKYQRKVTTLDSLHQFELEIEQKKVGRLLLLDSFSHNLLISPEFKKLALGLINVTATKDSLYLYKHNQNLLEQSGLYDQSIGRNLASINQASFSPFFPYQQACKLSLGIITKTKYYEGLQMKNAADFKNLFDFVDSAYLNMAKNYLLSCFICYAINHEIVIPSAYLLKYQKECTDEGYKKIITARLNEKPEKYLSLKGKNNLLTTNKTVIDLATLISQYKGNVLFIDFWASWCAACRQEIPFESKLANLYKGGKVIFLYISIDKDIHNWTKACAEEELNKHHSFLLLNADKAPFVEKYKINAIPRYILIGKNGEIINSDAPRPSESKLKYLIDKNL